MADRRAIGRGAICLGAASDAATAAGARSSHRQTPRLHGKAPSSSAAQTEARKESHITPEQARQLFSLVDELIKFSSQETGLPIKSTVKRQMTTRAAVESYLEEKFNEDQGAKRLQRDEIVLKKFGLLDRDFDLKPFLLALLKEQIEAYYDSKTKTVNMLDWVDVDEQKPVLAHELTHALQDQQSTWKSGTTRLRTTSRQMRPATPTTWPRTRWTRRATPLPRDRPPR